MGSTRSGAGRSLARPAVIVLLLAIVAAGALAAVALSTAEVVEKGKLLPYTDGTIYKVRVLGLTFYVEPDLKPSLDLLNGYLLTGMAFLALGFALLLARLCDDRASAAFRFFAVAFVGTSYLVADELLGLHETLGHNLPALARLPLVERPDDAVVLMMGALGAAVLWLFRAVILSSRAAVALFGAGLGLFLVSAVADLLSLPLEEAAEVAAALCLLAGMATLGAHHLAARLGSDQPAGTT